MLICLHHDLTRKDVPFLWSADGDSAFGDLKHRLTSAPVLVYPNFEASFVLETNASTQGLAAVLSQTQSSYGKLHPTVYASRASERRYGIMELETLAVVWGIITLSSLPLR